VLPLQRAVVNPLTGREVPAVTLAVAEELLIPVDPPELAGLPPIALEAGAGGQELEARRLAGVPRHPARLPGRAPPPGGPGAPPPRGPGLAGGPGGDSARRASPRPRGRQAGKAPGPGSAPRRGAPAVRGGRALRPDAGP